MSDSIDPTYWTPPKWPIPEKWLPGIERHIQCLQDCGWDTQFDETRRVLSASRIWSGCRVMLRIWGETTLASIRPDAIETWAASVTEDARREAERSR